jgi:hypothetical protein
VMDLVRAFAPCRQRVASSSLATDLNGARSRPRRPAGSWRDGSSSPEPYDMIVWPPTWRRWTSPSRPTQRSRTFISLR